MKISSFHILIVAFIASVSAARAHVGPPETHKFSNIQECFLQHSVCTKIQVGLDVLFIGKENIQNCTDAVLSILFQDMVTDGKYTSVKEAEEAFFLDANNENKSTALVSHIFAGNVVTTSSNGITAYINCIQRPDK